MFTILLSLSSCSQRVNRADRVREQDSVVTKEQKNDPLYELKVNVEVMSLEAIHEETTKEVLAFIEDKKAIEELEDQIKLSDNENAQAVNKSRNKLGKLRAKINARAQRYHVYADKLRAAGKKPPKIQDFQDN
jgi:hypothetical protein